MPEKPMTKLAERARALLRTSVDRQPTWSTPEQWTDSDGLYVGAQGAWLYRQLDTAVLSDRQRLQEVLTTLGQACPGRDVHLLVHTWFHLPTPDPGLPAALAAFQTSALQFLVPQRAAIVGVQLLDGAAAAGLPAQVRDGIDELLGESAPDLARFDQDRAHVTDTLGRCGAFTLSTQAQDFLEAWYNLGLVRDAEAKESDDAIVTSDGLRIELAAVAGVNSRPTAAALPESGSGANVASVRGHVQPDGTLSSCSVILGRACKAPISPWPIALRAMRAVNVRPLPLRQLAALNETLPCSSRRLSPTLIGVGADVLVSLGFSVATPAGAATGALLGLGGPQLTVPVYADLFAGDGMWLVSGGPRSGRTFLCELLAYQAHLAGTAVTYVSGAGDGGAGWAGLTGCPRWAPANAGDLDPFRWISGAGAAAAFWAVLTSRDTGLSAQELTAIEAGLRRATVVPTDSVLTALSLVDSPSAVARVLRALRTDPVLALFVANAGAPAGRLPEAMAVDLSALAGHLGALSAAALTMSAHRAAPHGGTRLVVIDAPGVLDMDPLWQQQLSSLAGDAQTAVLVTRDGVPERPASTWGHRVALAGTGSAGLAWVGAREVPGLAAWLDDGRAVLGDGMVETSAAGYYRDPTGQVSALAFGPWPEPVLARLTRGAATSYQP